MQSVHQKEYEEEIDTLLSYIKSDDKAVKNLADTQIKLDAIADKYQSNRLLGRNLYKLYEAQALIHYGNAEDELALKWINEAIRIRGESYKLADDLSFELRRSIRQNNKYKNYKWYGNPYGQMSPLHYLVGGISGVLITRWIYGSDVSLLLQIFSFIAWPLVWGFGIILLFTKLFTYILTLIF